MKYLAICLLLIVGCDQSGDEWQPPERPLSYRDQCRAAEELEDYSCECIETTYGVGRYRFSVEASSSWCASQEALDEWGWDCDAITEEDPSVLCSCSCEEE